MADAKHDRAICLITALLDIHAGSRSAIIGAMTSLDFNPAHVAILLREGTGTDPERYRWRADAGVYRNLH